jgi:hypothetical protein
MNLNKCPNCNNKLYIAGKIKIMGPNNKLRNTKIYYCKICRWRGT